MKLYVVCGQLKLYTAYRGLKKHKKYRFRTINTIERAKIEQGVHGSNSTQDIRRVQTVQNTEYRGLKY
jgi:hypothetical protein